MHPSGESKNDVLRPGSEYMAQRRFYYGWIVVGVSFISVFLALGTRFSFGVFYVAILDEYGWSQGQTAGAFSLAMLVHAIMSPMSGRLLDRVGPRYFFPLGAAFLTLGLLAASRTSSMLELYLYFGVLMSIGVNSLSYPPHMAQMSRWFRRKRGLANGLVLAGIGCGMMGLAPFIQMIIDSYGWRQAFWVIAIIVAVVVIPLTALFQKKQPSDVGQYPDGDPEPAGQAECKDQDQSAACRAWTLRQAFANRDFRFIFFLFFCNGIVMNMVVVHQPAHTVAAGYSTMLAAAMVGSVGILGSVGGILGGSLSDRIGRERCYMLASLSIIIGIVFLILAGTYSASWMLFVFALFYGPAQGSLPPIMAAKTGDLFSGPSVGMFMGLNGMGFGTGGALGAYLGGGLFDLTGSYTLPFAILVLCQIIGVISIRRAKW